MLGRWSRAGTRVTAKSEPRGWACIGTVWPRVCGVCSRVAVASVRGSRLAAAYSPALPPLERLGRDRKARFADPGIKTIERRPRTVRIRITR
jgi:hypothetical protein